MQKLSEILVIVAGPRHQGNVPSNLPPLTVKEQPQSTEEVPSQSNYEAPRDHEPLTDRPVASAGYAPDHHVSDFTLA